MTRMTRTSVLRRPGLGLVVVLTALALGLTGCGGGKMFTGKNKDKNKIGGERIAIMTFEKQLQLDPKLASVSVDLPAPVANSEWTQPGGNASHTLANLAGPAEFKRAWTVNTGAEAGKGTRQTAVPIVAGGKVFVLDTEVRVSAHDARSGKGLWRTGLSTKSERPEVGFGGGMAYDNGQLFVATGFGDVFALNPEDGAILWRKRLDKPFRSAPTATGGRIYVTSNDNELYVLDQNEGRILWNHRAIAEGARILSSSSPAVDGDAVVAPFSSGELVSFLAPNGRVAWSDSLTRTGRFTALSTLNDIAGPPVIDQGWVYAISHSGRMAAIDLRSGQRIWSQEISSIEMPWVAGDFIYLVTTEAQLMAIYRRDGSIKWLSQLTAHKDEAKKKPIVWSGPVLYGGKLVLVSSRGKARVYAPETGELLSEFKLPGPSYATPVVAGGVLYVMTNDGKLVAYGDEALRKEARPSRPKMKHQAEPMEDELDEDSRPFWKPRTPNWVPIVM